MFTWTKSKCVMCAKKFFAFHCKTCRYREFQLCDSCHTHSSHHKQERQKIGAR